MPFLNLGSAEILFILLLAFILLGPERISRFARDLGGLAAKLKKNDTFQEVLKTTDEIRNYPRKIMEEARLEEAIVFEDQNQFDDKMREHPMRMQGSEREQLRAKADDEASASEPEPEKD